MRRIATLLVVLATTAVSLGAVSPDEIVAMKKVGVSDAVLLAIIDRDQQIYTLDAKAIADLQREGISEQVILAMIKSGRDQHPATAPAPVPALPPVTAAAGPAAPPFADTGNFLIVGHYPDSPAGAAQTYSFAPTFFGVPDYYATSYFGGYYGGFAPFFFPGARGRGMHPRGVAPPFKTVNPSGPFLSDPMQRFQTPIVTLPRRK